MKNMIRSAWEAMKRAGEAARLQQWFEDPGKQRSPAHEYEALMRDLHSAGTGSGGHRFTREEMNER